MTLGQVLDFMQQDNLAMVHDLREKTLEIPSAEEIVTMIGQDPATAAVLGLPPELTDIAALLSTAESAEILAEGMDVTSAETGTPAEPAAPQTVSIGEIVDTAAAAPVIQKQREKSYSFRVKISELIDMFGREKLEAYVKEQTRLSNYIPAYNYDKRTIMGYWLHIGKFVLIFSLLAVIFLEFVDKDKR